MYKVFIENILLHIIDEKDLIPNDAFILNEKDIELSQKPLFLMLEELKTDFKIYLVSSNPDITFSKIFENFDFVEAAGGIVERENLFLFIKRNGFWDIPKGKLENAEIPEIGAVREIEEECGIIKPEIKDFICFTYHTYSYKGRQTIKKTYWYSLTYSGPQKLKGQIEEGITKAKWFKKSEIEKIKKNTFGSIIDVIDLYFGTDS